MDKLRKKPEILAPAGSLESLKGAIAAGADAVYIGGSRFGARAYADNPQVDDLLAAIDYVHAKDRRIYLTVNTLLKEQELTKELYPFLEKYYRAGVDAVIVQDVGVLHFLAAHFPGLPVHASTQMTLVSADGAKLLSDYPVTRIVPARELSLQEICTLRENTALEIEAFVHGALCYCYSGQCLFSSMIGGRSGNRGRCAQPCRMAYTVSDQGRKQKEGLYVLSPKDLCTLDNIPALVEAGIDSFKIEGRMKRPGYTVGVTAAYRLLTDLYYEYGEAEFQKYLQKHPDILSEQLDRVADLYNRGGFTKGYYVQYHGESMMSMNRPNHTGTLVGTVTEVKGIRAKIRLQKPLNPQDVLEIRNASKKDNADGTFKKEILDAAEAYEFTVGKDRLEEKTGWYETNVKKGFPLKVGQPVYRTKNEKLLGELREAYVEKAVQLPVRGEFVAIPGKEASLTLWLIVHEKSSLTPGTDAEHTRELQITVTGDEVMEAKNQPVTAEKIREQLMKTGESEFFFEDIKVVTGEKTFLPMGKIKELRRNAFEQLMEEILAGYRRENKTEQNVYLNMEIAEGEQGATETLAENIISPEVIVLVSTEEQCHSAMQEARITTVYVDVPGDVFGVSLSLCGKAKRAGKKAFLVLPHIFRSKDKRNFERFLQDIRPEVLDGFLVKSLEELQVLQETGLAQQFEIRLNYNMYVFQQEAKQFFREKGYTRFTVPVELNEEEIKQLGVEDCDFIIYGRMPLMVSAQCVRDNVFGCTKDKNTTGIVLTDRMGAEFPVRQNCSFCYNIIYNSACFSLIGMDVEQKLSPAGWRLDFTFETPEEMQAVLDAYFHQVPERMPKGSYTKGHWKRGVE